MIYNKEGNWSKFKVGTLLAGIAAVCTTVGAYLTGSVELGTTVTSLLTEVGAVLALFGVRDLPFVNRTK